MKQFTLKPENFDLEATMTCGQTFCWHRINGELYGDGPNKFYTFKNQEPVIVKETEEGLKVETRLEREQVEEALGLDYDLEKIFGGIKDEKIQKAREEFWGLRVLQDDFFPCLISYLCSPQMRIPRIKQMFNDMAREWGGTVEHNDHELLRFPTQQELSEASEEELRDLGVGYRAKYIVETLDILNDGFDHEEVRQMEYEDAREKMKELYGVGDKVADCVLLFSLGFKEAAPIDTWGKKALKAHYPEIHSDKYDEVSRNMRDYFGEHAGYAQEYIFHAARNGILEVE